VYHDHQLKGPQNLLTWHQSGGCTARVLPDVLQVARPMEHPHKFHQISDFAGQVTISGTFSMGFSAAITRFYFQHPKSVGPKVFRFDQTMGVLPKKLRPSGNPT